MNNLWSPAGALLRRWLNVERGLNDDSLRRWKIGFFPEACIVNGLNVHKGILIPWYFEGELWHLKARVNKAVKYLSITWEDKETPYTAGVPILYGDHTLPGKSMCFICEGEFDAMLLHQEAGELVGVVTAGGCKTQVDIRAYTHLLPMRHIFIGYDIDQNEAGQKGAEEIQKVSDRFSVINLWWGNDITDFHQTGGDLRAWVESCIRVLEQAEEEPGLPELTFPGDELGDGAPGDQVTIPEEGRLYPLTPCNGKILSAHNKRPVTHIRVFPDLRMELEEQPAVEGVDLNDAPMDIHPEETGLQVTCPHCKKRFQLATKNRTIPATCIYCTTRLDLMKLAVII